jgi:hypothetical protein
MESKDHNTLISLREYVDIRFDAQEKAVNAALAAADRAVNKAEIASEKRFENMNEFRGALADSARLLMPRSEFEQITKTQADRLTLMESRFNAAEARGRGESQSWIKIGLVIAAGANIGWIIYYLAGRAH